MHQEKIKIDDWIKITSKDDQRRVDTLKKYITNKTVLDFGAEKEELNGIIIYLLSDASSHLNSSIINIDWERTTW